MTLFHGFKRTTGDSPWCLGAGCVASWPVGQLHTSCNGSTRSHPFTKVPTLLCTPACCATLHGISTGEIVNHHQLATALSLLLSLEVFLPLEYLSHRAKSTSKSNPVPTGHSSEDGALDRVAAFLHVLVSVCVSSTHRTGWQRSVVCVQQLIRYVSNPCPACTHLGASSPPSSYE